MSKHAVQKQVDKQEIVIDLVVGQQKKTNEVMKELANHLENPEIRNRGDNVLPHDVPEVDKESREDCEALFLETVNAVLPSSLRVENVIRVHRFGKCAADKTNPFIARVFR